MLRVKRYVVSGVSHLTDGLTVMSVEPYTGQTYVPIQPATGGFSWHGWVLARSVRAARRRAVEAHDTYIATELAECGPRRFEGCGAMGHTDAGFNRR